MGNPCFVNRVAEGRQWIGEPRESLGMVPPVAGLFIVSQVLVTLHPKGKRSGLIR